MQFEAKYPMTARAIGLFFDAYKKHGTIEKACEKAGITVWVLRRWREKAKKDPDNLLHAELLREWQTAKERIKKRRQAGGNSAKTKSELKAKHREVMREFREKTNPKPKLLPKREPIKLPRQPGQGGRKRLLIDLDRMEMYGMLGFTPTMIAARENCGQDLIYKRFREKEKDAMWLAYQRGVASGDALLVETAYKKAVAEGKECSVPMLIFLLKARVGMRETSNVSVDIVPTDVSKKLKELAERHGTTYEEMLEKYKAIEV